MTVAASYGARSSGRRTRRVAATIPTDTIVALQNEAGELRMIILLALRFVSFLFQSLFARVFAQVFLSNVHKKLLMRTAATTTLLCVT